MSMKSTIPLSGMPAVSRVHAHSPPIRDDPTIDETTRLRNRIAELESLVRELRGASHDSP